jgi:putative copper resistance protein D
MTPDTVVGIVLLQSDQNLFPLMHAAHPDWAPSAVRDQQIGGALMWAAGDGIRMFLAVAVVVALIANPRRGAVIGTWLEGVRRRELAAHVAQGDPREAGFDDDADVDDDDAVLEAYNRMLQRLNRHPD